MDSKSFKITSGPCKRFLATALVELIDGKPIEVDFQTDYTTYRVTILGMEMEDGSRESWNLSGHVVAIGRQRLAKTMNAKIYFSSKRRSGNITFVN